MKILQLFPRDDVPVHSAESARECCLLTLCLWTHSPAIGSFTQQTLRSAPLCSEVVKRVLMGWVPLNDARGHCLPHETSPPVAWKKNRREKENEAFVGADHVVLKVLAASSWLQCEPSPHQTGVFSAGVSLYPGWAEGHCCEVAGADGPMQQERAGFTFSRSVWPRRRRVCGSS